VTPHQKGRCLLGKFGSWVRPWEFHRWFKKGIHCHGGAHGSGQATSIFYWTLLADIGESISEEFSNKDLAIFKVSRGGEFVKAILCGTYAEAC